MGGGGEFGLGEAIPGVHVLVRVHALPHYVLCWARIRPFSGRPLVGSPPPACQGMLAEIGRCQ